MNLKLPCAFLILSIPFTLNAHSTCTKSSSDDNNPYKIHMPLEQPLESEMLPFAFTALEGVTVFAEIQNTFTFVGTNILKDRHGEPFSSVSDHIGVFIYDGNSEQEITENRVVISPTEPNALTYDIRTYFRLKGNPADYSNDPVEITGRWRISCEL